MIVLFPEPEAPTKAVVFPSSKTAEKSSRTFWSGLEGYVKVTFLNSMLPRISSKVYEVGSSKRIFGFLSIVSKAILPATFPSATALMLGVAIPIDIAPKTTPKKQDITSPT